MMLTLILAFSWLISWLIGAKLYIIHYLNRQSKDLYLQSIKKQLNQQQAYLAGKIYQAKRSLVVAKKLLFNSLTDVIGFGGFWLISYQSRTPKLNCLYLILILLLVLSEIGSAYAVLLTEAKQKPIPIEKI